MSTRKDARVTLESFVHSMKADVVHGVRVGNDETMIRLLAAIFRMRHDAT
jgi:hypothetical protein